MSSLKDIGEAQLLAVEGQQQMAREVAQWLKRVLGRVLDRCLPNGTMAPW